MKYGLSLQKKLRTRAWREGQKVKEAPTEQDEVLDIYQGTDLAENASADQDEIAPFNLEDIAPINPEPPAKRRKDSEEEEDSDFYNETSESDSDDSDDSSDLPPLAKYW